jgi:hypothetical protein
MTLLDKPIEAGDSTQAIQVLFEEARRRRRRRWLVSGIVAIVVIGLGVLAWWVNVGAVPGQPPAHPRSPVGFPATPAVPPGATPIQTRTVNGWTIRIFASPSGAPLAKVDAEWELFDAHGSPEGSGSSTVGPAFAPGTGVVNLGGGSDEGLDGWQAVRNYPVTLPTVATVRVVDGNRVLDSMSPVTFDGVRFVVLAVINVPSLQPIVLQGLDASGAVISSSAFQLPDHPVGPRASITGGGSLRGNKGGDSSG